MTSLYESLKTICERRKSVRKFTGKDVAVEDIEKIKNIAYTSPYASNRKNWELVTITDKKQIQKIADLVRKKIAGLKTKVREDFQKDFSQYAAHFMTFEKAPVLIIPTFRISTALSTMLPHPEERVSLWERDNYVKSISCVAMLVLLAAESLGLVGCYMTGPLLAEKEIGELIQIKRGRNIGAIIPIGYSGDG
ncbi:MAG: nitroreductase family protein [Candidatus Aminicenantes bacterium]|nr:MAG: nitroreductase family protein [Candidatus Aminicenantes bacterium]